MKKAVGLIEVFGMATAYYAADAACKAGDVTIEAFDRNKPPNADELPVPLLIMIKIRGAVADVEAGVEAAARAAEEIAGVHAKYVIANPSEDMEKFLKISCL